MEVLWLTFRIEKDANYDERYGALIKVIEAHADTHWWFEPTSFWLFQTRSARDDIARAVASAIDVRKDLVLIGSMEHKGATLVGKAREAGTLRALVPDLR